ncbi:uncharacterized protein LOC119078419 isoform X2 [Bradysia coprophila]|nr:uncharacterized protein LOC119078419 isoform X2 [Bradysia coprophila]
MDNSKYLVWKLMFPRSGDTFFTIDKSLDLCSWEKLYSILKRITLQYAVSSELPLSSISVQCCEFWYRLTIEKVTMDIQSVHEFCGVDIDENLLHDEILCVKVYNSETFSVTEEASSSCARTPTPLSRKRTYSVTYKSVTERRTSNSSTPTKPTSSQTTTKPTPKRVRPINISPTSSRGPDCSTESIDDNDNIFLRYSDDDENENESERNGSDEQSPNSSSNETQSVSESAESIKEMEMEKGTLKVKMDLLKLNELLRDPKYLNGFCYESELSDCPNRTFNVYSVDERISYAAFHSPHMVQNIRDRSDRSDCKLFFRYSAEMLDRFNDFTEMKFDGIETILTVYVNHISDRVRPFGYVFLSNKNSSTLDNVVKVIDEWLNPVGAIAITVTKCVTPQDTALHQAIAETWPQAKLIGCSEEYQKDIKHFARQNKGLRSDNAHLTQVACLLCYLPAVHIIKGIELIGKSRSSEYAIKLVKYLQTTWMGRPISIYDENIVYRTLTVCKRFINQMLRNRFSDASYGRGAVLKDCWDFIEFLKTESKVNFVEMGLDGTKYGRGWRTAFALNTKLQKDRESCIVRIRNRFETNLKTMSQDDAVGQFLQEMLRKV